MTSRFPTVPPDELAVTFDEHAPPRRHPTVPPDHFPVGSDRDMPAVETTAERRRLDAAFFDTEPRTADLEARLTVVEKALPSAAENAKWIRRGVKVGGGVVGLAGAILVYLLAFARSSGDAAATAREREAQRQADHVLLLDISRAVAEMRGELRARNPVGMVPLLGPPTNPQDQGP